MHGEVQFLACQLFVENYCLLTGLAFFEVRICELFHELWLRKAVLAKFDGTLWPIDVFIFVIVIEC